MQKSELALIVIMILGSAFLGGMGAVAYYEYFTKDRGLHVPAITTKRITILSGAGSARLEVGLKQGESPFVRLLDEDSQAVLDVGIDERDGPSIRIGRSQKGSAGVRANPVEFGIDPSGAPFLYLKNLGSGGGAYYRFTEDGAPSLRLTDGKGGVLSLRAAPTSIGVEVLGHDDLPLVFMGYDNGVPNVSLFNPYLNNMCGFAANQNGTIVSFLNSDLRERIVMGLLGEEIPSLKILDDTSQPSFLLAPIARGDPRLALEFLDRSGRRRAVLGMDDAGQPVMKLYDENGKPLRK